MHILVGLNSVLKDPVSPPGTLWLDGNEPYLTFDDTTNERFKVVFRMPDAANNGIISYDWVYSMASATTNHVAVRTQVLAVSDGEDITSATQGLAEDSIVSEVPATAGVIKTLTHTITNNDGVAAGDYVVIEFSRDNTPSGSTNAVGDMYLRTLTIRVS